MLKDLPLYAPSAEIQSGREIFERTPNRGAGGEFHLGVTKYDPAMTTVQGISMANNHNGLKTGARGPTLLADFLMREKIFHFDHEHMPERILHACGDDEHAENFAGDCSQARQFYFSQITVEQSYLANALIFELSKVESPTFQLRVVDHLRHIDPDLAQTVADGLGLDKSPKPHDPAQDIDTTLTVSDPLSILLGAAPGFGGRKLGTLITDGVTAKLLNAVAYAVSAANATAASIAFKVSGATWSDCKKIDDHRPLAGAPSVLLDAMVILTDATGAADLAEEHALCSFIADAYAYAKCMANADAAGIAPDRPVVRSADADEAAAFVGLCAWLRFRVRTGS